MNRYYLAYLTLVVNKLTSVQDKNAVQQKCFRLKGFKVTVIESSIGLISFVKVLKKIDQKKLYWLHLVVQAALAIRCLSIPGFDYSLS